MSKSRKKSAKMNIIHFQTLTGRYARQIVTKPTSFLMLLLQAPVMVLIVYIIYKKDSFLPNQIKGVNDITRSIMTLFVIILVGSLMGLLNSYREITKERDVLRREMTGGLDPTAYVASKLFVQAVIAFVQAGLLIGGVLLFIKFDFVHPVMDIPLFFAIEFLTILSSSAIGLAVSAIVKNGESAILPVLIIIICQVVFSGAIFQMDGPASFIGYLMPARWGTSAMGNLLHLNGKMHYSVRAIFDDKFYLGIIALVIITVLCYTVAVAVIKGTFRKKKI